MDAPLRLCARPLARSGFHLPISAIRPPPTVTVTVTALGPTPCLASLGPNYPLSLAAFQARTLRTKERPRQIFRSFSTVSCLRYSSVDKDASKSPPQKEPPSATDRLGDSHDSTTSSRPDAQPDTFSPSTPPQSQPNAASIPHHASTLAIRINHLTEQLLTTLSRLAHQLNIYTGTDYTPISTLRTQITTQESHLRDLHTAVASAKSSLSTASSTQAASQKEVVQLLERKHSWSASDLERYMSLIRSEHEHEQAVLAARTDLADAERALEQGRQALERMERRMYHEEQVWSDTIRRNSTWITFGLMGLNMALLLGNLVVVEPWRRRRLVRELTAVVDERTGSDTSPTQDREVVLFDDDGVLLDAKRARAAAGVPEAAHKTVAVDAAALPQSASQDIQADATALGSTAIESGTLPPTDPAPDAQPSGWFAWLPSLSSVFAPGAYADALWRLNVQVQELFSERVVATRQVDITNVALEGFAAGAVAVVVALWLLEQAID